MSEGEAWRPIAGAPGYSVSSEGRISGPRRGILSPVTSSLGYVVVSLPGKAKGDPQVLRRVHRLVCMAFHGAPPTPVHQAAHIDGDKTNNAARNVCWATALENSNHKRAHGTILSGDTHPSRKITSEDVRAIRAAHAAAPRSKGRVRKGTICALMAKYGVSRPLINKIIAGDVWKDTLDAP